MVVLTNTVKPRDHNPYAANVVSRKVVPAAAITPIPGITKSSTASMTTPYANPSYLSSAIDPMTDTLSPPYSPPPIYSAVPAQGWVNPQARIGLRTPADPYSAKYGEVTVYSSPSTVEKGAGGNIAASETGMKKAEVWANEYRREEAIPELQGDTVSFSATNLGPVNPFELFAGPTQTKSLPTPQPMAISAVTEPNCVETLSEAMGDISFTAELPANNPGKAHGYPPISKNFMVSELPTDVPRRRPLPSRAVTSPLAHELPVQHESREYESLSCQELPSAEFSGFGNAYDHRNTSPQWTHATRHGSVPSVSSPMMEPLSSAPSPLSTPIMGNATHVAYSQHIVSPLITPAMPVAQSLGHNLQRAETTASSRMQRQKSFMNMLGAIDQS